MTSITELCGRVDKLEARVSQTRDRMIEFAPSCGDYMEGVMISRIVRLSKTGDDGEYTVIHLDTGDKLVSEDSMKTLVARINLA